jgi:hypothetical protein
MLPDKHVMFKNNIVSIWKIPLFRRVVSGIACTIKWQNVYRNLPLISLGTHIPDQSRLYTDIGYGLSLNFKGFHLFVGLIFEAQTKRDF